MVVQAERKAGAASVIGLCVISEKPGLAPRLFSMNGASSTRKTKMPWQASMFVAPMAHFKNCLLLKADKSRLSVTT